MEKVLRLKWMIKYYNNFKTNVRKNIDNHFSLLYNLAVEVKKGKCK